jgi:hypothetical protein
VPVIIRAVIGGILVGMLAANIVLILMLAATKKLRGSHRGN